MLLCEDKSHAIPKSIGTSHYLGFLDYKNFWTSNLTFPTYLHSHFEEILYFIFSDPHPGPPTFVLLAHKIRVFIHFIPLKMRFPNVPLFLHSFLSSVLPLLLRVIGHPQLLPLIFSLSPVWFPTNILLNNFLSSLQSWQIISLFLPSQCLSACDFYYLLLVLASVNSPIYMEI